MLSWFIPKRWEMCLMLFTATIVAYTMRVNMSVATLAMKKDLGWTDSGKGLALSAFYWGYAGGLVLAAPLVQYVGAKRILGLSILFASIFSLFSPVAWEYSFGLGMFMRVMTGFAESFFFPAIYHFIPAWIPLEEKTLMVPIIYSGSYVGNIIGFSISGSIIEKSILIGGKEYGMWYSVFYIFALFGFAFVPYWFIMAYEKPENHPGITADELEIINAGKHYADDTPDVPDRYEMPEDSTKDAQVAMLDLKERRSDEILGPDHVAVATTDDDGAGTVDAEEDEDAHEVEYTYPIAIEHMAFNMLSTGSSRTARIHSHSAKPTGRPRKISIVSEHKIRNEMAAHTPWANFFTHPVALTMFLNSWVNGWIGFTLLSEMPPYLFSLGFSVTQAGTLSVYPYAALFIATLAYGGLFEYLHVHVHWSTDRVRRVAETVSYLGSGVFLVICGFMEEKYTSYAFLIVTQSFYGAIQSGVQCSYSDCAPNYSSALNTIGNCLSAIAGIAGPLIVAALTEAMPEHNWGWRVAFFITFAQGIIALIFWYMYQTSEIVPALNNPTSEHHMKRIQSLVPKKNPGGSSKKNKSNQV